ncbi:MAG: cytochrome family protein [Verrucomicrobiales bacterium]|nr:cytochrome family protein [Verrucomicrobiales bacterium]
MPKPSFFLGHLPYFRENPLGFLEACIEDGADLVPLRFLNRRVLLVNDPQQIETILTSQSKNFRKTIGYRTPFMRRLFGQGLLTSEGPLWTQQRRLAQPAFHRERIASYADIIVRFAKDMLTTWQSGQQRDVHDDVMKLTTRVVVKTLFNAEVPPAIAQLGDASEAVLTEFTRQYGIWRFIRGLLPGSGSGRFEQVLQEIDQFIYGLIRERRQNGENAGDLLSMLLSARDETGQGMNDQQLRDELVTLMVAGLDTTALAVSWSLFLLAKNPGEQTKLIDEIRQTVGSRPPAFADLPQLRYTDAILKESMRLFPPAWIIGREALSETQIGPHRLRKGDSAIMSQWLKHRDPRHFPDAMTFRPSRWLDGSTSTLPKFAYFPFGGGPRVCIGSNFATMEGTLVLATIFQAFEFECEPGYDVQPWPSITLQARGGIHLRLKKSSDLG